jgi:hypothetical protein
MVQPVVLRASSARCASRTSASGKRWSMRIFTLPLVTMANRSSAIFLRGLARGDVGEQRLAA